MWKCLVSKLTVYTEHFLYNVCVWAIKSGFGEATVWVLPSFGVQQKHLMICCAPWLWLCNKAIMSGYSDSSKQACTCGEIPYLQLNASSNTLCLGGFSQEQVRTFQHLPPRWQCTEVPELCSSCLSLQWPGLVVQDGGGLQDPLGSGHMYKCIHRKKQIS